MPSRNTPQTKDDLRRFRRVEVSIITRLRAVSDGRLLKIVEQVFPIPLDKQLKTMLNWAVKDFGISYTTAMESCLAKWFKELETDKAVYQDMRKAVVLENNNEYLTQLSAEGPPLFRSLLEALRE